MHDVILLPGLACDATLWRDQVPVLCARHRVAVTDVHARFDTLPEMAAALLAEHAGELVLCGTSMGGMVALEAARQAPQRVKALAMLGTSARADTPELLALRREAIGRFEAGEAEVVIRANVMFAFHPRAQADAGLVATYLGIVLRGGSDALIRQNRAIMARADLRPMLGSISCPTLVVCGDGDLLTPPEHSRELAAGIPGARLEMLPECGHLLTLEQPARVNTLLLDWLAELA
jgi:pimeloyl-ACP methyl ester carboxylesterase